MTMEKSESVADSAAKLKKAGFPVIVSVLVALAGAPGAWEFFFNRTDEVAAVKAEMSYQLLKAQTERIEDQLAAVRSESAELRRVLTAVLMQRSGVGFSGIQIPAAAPAPAAKPLPDSLDGLVDAKLDAAE